MRSFKLKFIFELLGFILVFQNAKADDGWCSIAVGRLLVSATLMSEREHYRQIYFDKEDRGIATEADRRLAFPDHGMLGGFSRVGAPFGAGRYRSQRIYLKFEGDINPDVKLLAEKMIRLPDWEPARSKSLIAIRDFLLENPKFRELIVLAHMRLGYSTEYTRTGTEAKISAIMAGSDGIGERIEDYGWYTTQEFLDTARQIAKHPSAKTIELLSLSPNEFAPPQKEARSVNVNHTEPPRELPYLKDELKSFFVRSLGNLLKATEGWPEYPEIRRAVRLELLRRSYSPRDTDEFISRPPEGFSYGDTPKMLALFKRIRDERGALESSRP